MESMFLAESAVLVHLQPVGCVLFVFHAVVVALFALRAGKGHFDSHNGTSIFSDFQASLSREKGTKKEPSLRGKNTLSQIKQSVKFFDKKTYVSPVIKAEELIIFSGMTKRTKLMGIFLPLANVQRVSSATFSPPGSRREDRSLSSGCLISMTNSALAMVMPGMAQRGGGSVIIVSSIGGLLGSDVLGVYSISKAADLQLARNIAVEWGSRNIRGNCIAPGLVRTDFARALWENQHILDKSGCWVGPRKR